MIQFLSQSSASSSPAASCHLFETKKKKKAREHPLGLRELLCWLSSKFKGLRERELIKELARELAAGTFQERMGADREEDELRDQWGDLKHDNNANVMVPVVGSSRKLNCVLGIGKGVSCCSSVLHLDGAWEIMLREFHNRRSSTHMSHCSAL